MADGGAGSSGGDGTGIAQKEETFFRISDPYSAMAHLKILGDTGRHDIDFFAQPHTVFSKRSDGSVLVFPNEDVLVATLFKYVCNL